MGFVVPTPLPLPPPLPFGERSPAGKSPAHDPRWGFPAMHAWQRARPGFARASRGNATPPLAPVHACACCTNRAGSLGKRKKARSLWVLLRVQFGAAQKFGILGRGGGGGPFKSPRSSSGQRRAGGLAAATASFPSGTARPSTAPPTNHHRGAGAHAHLPPPASLPKRALAGAFFFFLTTGTYWTLRSPTFPSLSEALKGKRCPRWTSFLATGC